MNYIREVNKLIPFAEREAKKRVRTLGVGGEMRKGVDGKKFGYSYFTEFFHEEMRKLCREMGLRR